jgi:hypothetical protein
MGKLSRTKGASFERTIANELRDALRLPREAARRGLQSRGGGAEVPDVEVDGLPLHFETKHSGSISPAAALRQAARDSLTRGIPLLPVVILKRDRVAPVVFMYGADFAVFMSAVVLCVPVSQALFDAEVALPLHLSASSHRGDEHLAVSLPWDKFLAALAGLPPLPSALPLPVPPA